MPQDGSNNYQYPPGTPGIPDQTIESEAYNTFLDDLVTNDLNIPRPIHRGGTGATDAIQALVNLGGEKSSQIVTNYDTQVFLSGSFYSAVGATNAPVAGHAFVGIAYSSDPPATPPANLNWVIEARDQNDTSVPGKLYVREKKAGVWGPWITDASSASGPAPPTGLPDGALFWNSTTGVLYVNYNDGNSTQLVQAVALPAIDTSLFALKPDVVLKAGDTMTGLLTLSGDPSAIMHAATKQYVDSGVGGVGGGLTAKVDKAGGAGGVMTGLLTLSGDPTAVLHAATKQYVDAASVVAMADSGMQINGGMEVDQPNAGASIAVPAGTSAPFLIDGWNFTKAGTNAFTAQQVASIFPGYNSELKLTVTTAQASIGTDLIRLENRIEGYRFVKAGWGTAAAQPVTVGCWVRSSVAGNITLQISDNAANASNQTLTVTSANVAQFVTATFPAQSAWAGSKTSGVGAAVMFYLAHSSGINIAATVGNTFEITGLVVLPGARTITAAQSPLLMRSYDQELMTCQRYYQIVGAGLQTYATASGFYSEDIMYPTVMRAAPTAALFATIQNTGFGGPIVEHLQLDSVRITAQATGGGQSGFSHFYKMDARL